MTSHFTRLSVLASLLALTMGLLVATAVSSEAKAKPKAGILVTSTKVAVYPDGGTAVYVVCRNTKTDCRGTARYALIGGGAGSPAAAVPYFMRRGKGGYIQVNVGASQQRPAGLGPTNALGANVELRESKPYARTFLKNVSLEQAQTSRTLRGTVTGTPDTDLTDVTVNAKEQRGNRIVTIASISLPGDTGAFDFGPQPIGFNNSAVTSLYLTLSGKVDGVKREWFWRGNESGGFESGTKSDFTATRVAVGSGATDYIANFEFGTVSGSITPGASSSAAKVTVAGAPIGMPGLDSVQKNLDFPYCAETYGTETASGTYSIPFVPRVDDDKRYAILAEPAGGGATTLWNNSYGSCIQTRQNGFSNANLLAFSGGVLNHPIVLKAATASVTGSVGFAGFSATGADRLVDIRSYVPGKPILSMPIVARSVVAANGQYSVPSLVPGYYFASAGRVTACSAYYPSKYANNRSHFTGESDRATEIWKSFRTLNSLPGDLRAIAVAHGAGDAQTRVPGGYAGWMYRDVCRSDGEGAYIGFGVDVTQAGLNVGIPHTTNSRGATVSGHVGRSGGRTKKEMMVSLYSTQGTLVMRSAYANGSGNFTIHGLASGNYAVVVNGDSWRGLGRTFKGKHFIRVKAGKGYKLGTVTAKF